MKFTIAWSEILTQNQILKVVIGTLSLSIVVLSITAAKLALSPPLVVERACYSRVLQKVSPQASPSEIEAFVREALRRRFDSDAVDTAAFLSQEEDGFRRQEQDNLKSRNMTQVIIVRQVKVSGSTVNIDSDRLLSIGQVRSAFVFPLSGTLATTQRTDANPYGLILVKVSQVKEEPSK